MKFVEKSSLALLLSSSRTAKTAAVDMPRRQTRSLLNDSSFMATTKGHHDENIRRLRRGRQLQTVTATEVAVVGTVTSTTAVIQFRTSDEADVQVKYSTSADLSSATLTLPVFQTQQTVNNLTGMIELTGLVANAIYYYRIVVDGIEQDPGFVQQFKTFPDGTVGGGGDTCKFAVFADVANNLTRNAPIYEQGKLDGALFAMQIGDLDHRNPQTLAESRIMHREIRDPIPGSSEHGVDFATHILSKMGIVHVWDDHDYCGNDTDKTCASKVLARKAFDEYWPTYTRPKPKQGIWHKFSCGGDTVEIFMLDTRSQRDPDLDPDDSNKSMLDGDNLLNGQKEWLKYGLRDSSATWKIVVSTVTANRDARPSNVDHWATQFTTEAAEMNTWIASENIENVVMISADLHTGGGIDDSTNNIWGIPEMNVAHTNLQKGMGDASNLGTWSEGVTLGTTGPGYGMVTVSSTSMTLEAKDENGNIRHTYTLTPV